MSKSNYLSSFHGGTGVRFSFKGPSHFYLLFLCSETCWVGGRISKAETSGFGRVKTLSVVYLVIAQVIPGD